MKTLLRILPFLILILHACNEDDKPAAPVKQVTTDGIGLINFPAGSITADKVSLEKINDSGVTALFNETSDLFNVRTTSSYQIKLDIGKFPPNNDSIKATFNIPSTISSGLAANYGIELFALVYQDGGEEVLDLFEIITSQVSADKKTLSAKLPAWLFTNARNAQKTYEAVFVIATTPGSNLSGRIASSNEECQAGQILCPLGDEGTCTQKKTSDFGLRDNPVTKTRKPHWGIDFGVPVGTPVYSAADGVVKLSRTQANNKGYGMYIVVLHANGSSTLYAHLSSTKVAVGQKVKADELIAYSGNSGGSSGPHLHFEYVPNGEIIQSKSRINPMPCISSGNAKGSLTVSDNGSIADDAFEVYLEGIFIGKTEIGQPNSMALSNLRPGEKILKLVCTVAPDNVGTYEVYFDDGITFKDGSTTASGTLAQGGSTQWTIVIPKNSKGGRVHAGKHLPTPNAYIEK